MTTHKKTTTHSVPAYCVTERCIFLLTCVTVYLHFYSKNILFNEYFLIHAENILNHNIHNRRPARQSPLNCIWAHPIKRARVLLMVGGALVGAHSVLAIKPLPRKGQSITILCPVCVPSSADLSQSRNVSVLCNASWREEETCSSYLPRGPRYRWYGAIAEAYCHTHGRERISILIWVQNVRAALWPCP